MDSRKTLTLSGYILILIGLVLGLSTLLPASTSAQTGGCVTGAPYFNEGPVINYDEENQEQTISVSVFTQNCAGQPITIELWEIDDDDAAFNLLAPFQASSGAEAISSAFQNNLASYAIGSAFFQNIAEDKIPGAVTEYTPQYNASKVTFTYRPGEDFCEPTSSLSQVFTHAGESSDCDIFIKFKNPSIPEFQRSAGSHSGLFYDCDGVSLGLITNACNQDPSVNNKWDWVNTNEEELLALTGSGAPGSLFSVGEGLCAGEDPNTCYELLTPLPVGGGETSGNLSTRNFGDFSIVNEDIDLNADGVSDYRRQYLKGVVNFGSILNILVELVIGLLGLGAVIMIIIAGFQYMSSVNPGSKTAAKERFFNAILGLVIALGSFIILNTINPNLLRIDPRIDPVVLDLGGDPSVDFQNTAFSHQGGTVTAFTIDNIILNVDCPQPAVGDRNLIPGIAASFIGDVTYRYGGKGGNLPAGSVYPLASTGGGNQLCDPTQQVCRTFCPEGQACIDCSGFVAHVLRCAGLPYIPSGTGKIFSGSTPITNLRLTDTFEIEVNNDPSFILQPGDLVGSAGKHVGIYIGNGQFAHSTAHNGGRDPGKAIQIADILSAYDGGNSSWLTHVRTLDSIPQN